MPAAIGAVLLVAAGCAPVRDLIHYAPPAEDVISAGFRNISERYINPVSLRELTVAGAKSVAAMDPETGVTEGDGALRLLVHDTVAQEWREPLGQEPEPWARILAEFTASLRKNSVIVGSRSDEDMYSAIFKGAMTGLDRYSRYASAKTARQRQAARDGFGGLGITIKQNSDETTIIEVHEDTPAAQAGLKEDDVILMVDGRPLRGLSQSEVVDLLRGPIDSRVRLTVRREGLKVPITVTATRDLIMIPTVKARTENGLLILKVSGFNVGTARAVRENIESAKRGMGRKLRGVIMDLRGNPGGLLKQAVRVADLFLEGGLIISTRGRHRASYQVFDATRGDITEGRPLVILVNGRSASSAEIVAAALRDRGRAIVLGSSSYGKGTVQTILRLPNGGEMTLTWAKLYTPAGYELQSRGIVPSICTNGAGRTLQALRSALLSGRWKDGYRQNARLRLPSAPSGSYRQLRAVCPPDSGKPSVDIKIADLVLKQGRLYRDIIAVAHPALAAEPGSPSG